MKCIRILLVEDDADISELIAELLAVMGHDVCGTAVTELEAIDAAGVHTPDLMIVDVYLRIGNGVSAMKIIHQRTAMPHIFMTAGPRHIIPKDSIVLHKPFGTADLTKALERVIWQAASATPGSAHLKP